MHVGSTCSACCASVKVTCTCMSVRVTCMLIVHVVVWSVHYLENTT